MVKELSFPFSFFCFRKSCHPSITLFDGILENAGCQSELYYEINCHYEKTDKPEYSGHNRFRFASSIHNIFPGGFAILKNH